MNPATYENAYRKAWQSLPEVKKPQTHSNTWAKGKKGEYKPERQKLMADIYRDLQKNGPQLSRTIAERMGLATNTVSQLLQEIRKRHGTVEGKKDKTLGAFVWRAKKEAGK